MEKEMSCPLCKKELYTGLGKGCKMCGMPLEKKEKDFCSENCKRKYKKIRETKKISKAMFSFLFVLFLLNSVSAHTENDSFGHHSMMFGNFWFGWIFMIILSFLITVCLVLFIIWLIKQIQRDENRGKR